MRAGEPAAEALTRFHDTDLTDVARSDRKYQPTEELLLPAELNEHEQAGFGGAHC